MVLFEESLKDGFLSAASALLTSIGRQGPVDSSSLEATVEEIMDIYEFHPRDKFIAVKAQRDLTGALARAWSHRLAISPRVRTALGRLLFPWPSSSNVPWK